MKKLTVFLALATLVSAPAFASEQLAQKAGCLACHAKDKKMMGPAFKDIAAKYKDQKDAVPHLMDKVRKGGSGVWGQIPMAANPPEKINDADLKAVIEWVLKG